MDILPLVVDLDILETNEQSTQYNTFSLSKSIFVIKGTQSTHVWRQ